jgi:hypothetical protein
MIRFLAVLAVLRVTLIELVLVLGMTTLLVGRAPEPVQPQIGQKPEEKEQTGF